MRTLTRGSSGPDVVTLQTALNGAINAGLTVDGRYGFDTGAAVYQFQDANWLVEDGVAGPCTQNALFGAETYLPILWNPHFIPQPTRQTCWAASTAMMTNTSVPVAQARTPADLILPDGGLANKSNTDDAFTDGQRFARANGITLISAAASVSLDYFRQALARGPVMLDMLWNPKEYIEGRGSPGHMILVVGMRGDDDPSGKGTTVRVFDPWPPNVGDQSSFGFFKWINEVTTRTYQMFQR